MSFDPSRSTPAGYWHFAAQYFRAAEAVRAAPQALTFPSLQLYGQSIELCLKAFLLRRGTTLAEVNGMRHRLSEIVAAARKRRLGTQVKLSSHDLALINLLNENYATHRFRYIVTGATRIPQPSYIAPISERLLSGLEFYCTGVKRGIHR
jgi:hypothetical protein